MLFRFGSSSLEFKAAALSKNDFWHEGIRHTKFSRKDVFRPDLELEFYYTYFSIYKGTFILYHDIQIA